MSANLPDGPAKTGKVVNRSSFDDFKHYIQQRAAIEGPLAIDALNEEQTEKILKASTEEELEAAMEMIGLVGLRDVPNGTVVQINGYHVVPGSRDEYKNKLEVFAVIDATMLSDTQRFGKIGVNVLLDTGITRIITWLRAIESGQIPGMEFPVQRIVVKHASGKGDMITLKRVPQTPIVGETSK